MIRPFKRHLQLPCIPMRDAGSKQIDVGTSHLAHYGKSTNCSGANVAKMCSNCLLLLFRQHHASERKTGDRETDAPTTRIIHGYSVDTVQYFAVCLFTDCNLSTTAECDIASKCVRLCIRYSPSRVVLPYQFRPCCIQLHITAQQRTLMNIPVLYTTVLYVNLYLCVLMPLRLFLSLRHLSSLLK